MNDRVDFRWIALDSIRLVLQPDRLQSNRFRPNDVAVVRITDERSAFRLYPERTERDFKWLRIRFLNTDDLRIHDHAEDIVETEFPSHGEEVSLIVQDQSQPQATSTLL